MTDNCCPIPPNFVHRVIMYRTVNTRSHVNAAMRIASSHSKMVETRAVIHNTTVSSSTGSVYGLMEKEKRHKFFLLHITVDITHIPHTMAVTQGILIETVRSHSSSNPSFQSYGFCYK